MKHIVRFEGGGPLDGDVMAGKPKDQTIRTPVKGAVATDPRARAGRWFHVYDLLDTRREGESTVHTFIYSGQWEEPA